VALIQSGLGQAEEALETWNQAAAIAEDTSRNVFAIILSNRAEVLTYLGRYEDAERDFKQAVNLFAVMDDNYSLAMAHLLWGYEYCLIQERWLEARYHFDEACKAFDFHSDNYPEEKARLLIGLGCLDLAVGTVEDARKQFQTALDLIEGKQLNWWLPPASYYMGLICLQDENVAQARLHFTRAVESAEKRGCPDYLPLAFLGLARLETEPEQMASYLRKCMVTAEKRARYGDRLYCLETAEKLLEGLRLPET
jgi:tetratricopeptide (TPR) repeat protein